MSGTINERLGRKPAAILAVGLAIALALAAVGLRQNTPPPSGLEGQRAPQIDLPILALQPARAPARWVKPVLGKATLLHFWGPSCAPCVKQAPAVAALHQEGVKSGAFEVITISAEDVPDIRAFLRETGHSYPVLHDADGRAHGSYRVNAIPVDFVIDKLGVVQQELRGPHDIDELRTLLNAAAQ